MVTRVTSVLHEKKKTVKICVRCCNLKTGHITGYGVLKFYLKKFENCQKKKKKNTKG